MRAFSHARSHGLELPEIGFLWFYVHCCCCLPLLQSSMKPKHKSAPAEPVDINTADQAQLMTLKYVGKVISRHILVHRVNEGPYKDWNDLVSRVKLLRNKAKFLRRYIVFKNLPPTQKRSVPEDPLPDSHEQRLKDIESMGSPPGMTVDNVRKSCPVSILLLVQVHFICTVSVTPCTQNTSIF